MYAVSRLMLNNYIPNLQVSWVKEGPKLSQIALLAGANDFGGTLINESISTAAGASYGQLMKPSQFRGMIREMGRIPAERSTTYQKIRVFESEAQHRDLLDEVNDPAQRFGSYQNLIHLKAYRFRDFYREQKEPKHQVVSPRSIGCRIMNANPAQFEAIGTRLGFRVVEQTPDSIRLLWRGPRFPAFLCLGIALLLLFISVPIVEAIRIRGFVGPAGSLWYFPLMNLILFGIAFFLLTQRRTIEIDPGAGRLSLRRQSLYRSVGFTATGSEIAGVTLGIDRVYSGFALGGSTAAERFPVPALRLESQQRRDLASRSRQRSQADRTGENYQCGCREAFGDRFGIANRCAHRYAAECRNRSRLRNRGAGDQLMQLRDAFFDAFVSELLRGQPSHAALADNIADGKNIFAQ